MKDVAGEGRTVLFVSHNMTTITSLCSRAILLDKGKLKAAGTSLDMVAEYLNMNTQEECPSYLYEYDGLKNISEPPSERVILQNAKLLYEDGSYAKVPKTTDTLFIEIEYEVNNITALLIPDLNLYGGPGEELIFTSVRNEDNSHTNGRYKTSIEIPKNFLNLGVYTVGLEINSMDPFNRHVGFRRLLQFEVFDDLNSGSREGHVSLFTRGLIRPEIKWESNKL
jgi:lipopolysaccharide transport system ATP-binding protein